MAVEVLDPQEEPWSQSTSLLLSMKDLAETVAGVEGLSKVVEQLQVLGAQALDRHATGPS